jgi:anti-sigma B factor antagonist
MGTAPRLGGSIFEVPSGLGQGGGVLNFEQEEFADGCTICRPIGELDAFTVSQFRQALAELASKPRLVIDLSGVPFVDTAGLGALIGGIRRARELGGDVVVSCNRPSLVHTLHSTGFDRIVTLTGTVEEARAAFA